MQQQALWQLAKIMVCTECRMNLQTLQSSKCAAMFASGREQRKSATREREEVPQVLTVKETMLDTNVVNAEGMEVSCLGMGLMRSCTFCIPFKQLTLCQSGGSPEQGAKYTKTCHQNYRWTYRPQALLPVVTCCMHAGACELQRRLLVVSSFGLQS